LIGKALRDHLRSNVVGYIALFCFAMSGTAIALDGSNTVFSDDIVNGGVHAADLGPDAVRTSKILDGQVRSADIGNNTVQGVDILDATLTGDDVLDESLGAADLGTGSVGTDEIATSAVASEEIANETITTNDLQSNSVQFDEIEDGTVGKADIGPAAVGASEVGDGVITRAGTPVAVPGGAGENGSYTVNTATAACNAGEELIGGTGQWTPDDNASGDFELFISEVRLNTTAESVIVDGGNDSGVDHNLAAVAVCLQI
jgi:hypothetical protein